MARKLPKLLIIFGGVIIVEVLTEVKGGFNQALPFSRDSTVFKNNFENNFQKGLNFEMM